MCRPAPLPRRHSSGRFGQWPLVLPALLLCLTACRLSQDKPRSTSPRESTADPGAGAPIVREPPLVRCEFKSAHMGTLFFIVMYAPDVDEAEAAAEAAFRRINALEEVMSDYQADSELNQFRGHPAGMPRLLSPELFDVLSTSQRFSEISGGAFDVTIGPYVRLWRFSRKRGVLPAPAELQAACEAVGWRNLRLDPKQRTGTLLTRGMRLDLGGIAKGYAADAALALLGGRGLDRALVAASGDVAVGNAPPGEPGWKVAISGLDSGADPRSNRLLLRHAAVSTSGDTEQFVEIDGRRYSHIVSPWTGVGLTNRIQATVVGPNATTTDAMATAVCVLGRRRGLALIRRQPGLETMVIAREEEKLRCWKTPGFDQLTVSASSAAKALYTTAAPP